MTESRKHNLERLEGVVDALLERADAAPPEQRAALFREPGAAAEVLAPLLAEPGVARPDQTPTDSGQRLAGYLLVGELGRGGMGVVFEAEDPSLRRRVAIKVLPAHLTLRPSAVARFQREAEAVARLQHHGIVRIHAVGSERDTHYFVMELVRGASLDRVLRRLRERGGGVPADAARFADALAATMTPPPAAGEVVAPGGSYVAWCVQLVAQVADALAHSHQAGVIHRDVKPSNILVRPDGTAVLTDFGVARMVDEDALTMTGDVTGTPHYLSPEQALAGRVQVDHRADVFALGITLYELLTLTHPFDGTTREQVLSRIVTREPVDPQRLNRELASDLSAIVFRALEKDPDRRYQTASAFAEDLRAFLAYRPVTARRASAVTRGLRWLRREPLKAALLGTLLLAVPVTTGVLGYLLAKQPVLEAGETTLHRQRVESLLLVGYLAVLDAHQRSPGREFDRVLELAPTDPDVHLGLVLSSFWGGSAEVALGRLAEADRLLPGEPALVRARAGLLRILDRRSEADALVARLAAPATPLDLFVAAYLGMLGVGEEAHNQPGVPLALAEEAVLRCPLARPHYYWLLAMTTVHACDFAAARRVCNAMGALWPDNDTIQEARAIALGRVSDEESARIYERLIERHPDRVDLLLDVALSWTRMGQLDKALAACARVEAQNLEDPTVLGLLGARLLKLGDSGRARRALKRALEIAPDHWVPLLYHGIAQAGSGQWAEAKATLARVLARKPLDAEANRFYGVACVQLGDLAGAEAPMRTSVKSDPTNAMAWFYLAAARLARGAVRDAREAFERASKAPFNAQPGMVEIATALAATRTNAEMVEVLAPVVEESRDAEFLGPGLAALRAAASRPARDR